MNTYVIILTNRWGREIVVYRLGIHAAFREIRRALSWDCTLTHLELL